MLMKLCMDIVPHVTIENSYILDVYFVLRKR
jgi:hypothetical protein